MTEASDAFLIVVKGAPYQNGDALLLSGEKLSSKDGILLGRTWQDHRPDFAFDSPYVSRRQANINWVDGKYYLTDVPGNRHGTWLNNERLAPGAPQEIKQGDHIGLAQEEVMLTFVTAALLAGETWDFPTRQPPPRKLPEPVPAVYVDKERHDVLVDGEPRVLVGKPFALLCLLYDNRGRAVSDADIKKAVWPERALGPDGVPLVGDEELAALVYRLRERLEPHGDLIRTVPRYGYMLDLPG